MDDFAKLPSQERRLYFEQTAARLGLSAQIIEKDFWVCWTLKRLFALHGFRDHLTFKGGTTLSKVYRIIERFSEDIDVVLEIPASYRDSNNCSNATGRIITAK
jgi:predicted nucleotidyltransferase component of viral defense system